MKNYLTKFFIVLLALILLTTGLVFGVIVIVINHPDLIVWAIAGAVIINFSILFMGIRYLQRIFSGKDKRTIKFLETGAKAMATIVNIEGTAWRKNYNPVVRLSLRVKPSTRPAFDAKIETTFVVYKPLKIGDNIEVVYNPENLLEIMVAKA